MRTSGTRIQKAGLPGLFLWLALVISIAAASAQPLLLEVEKAEAAFDQRTRAPIISVRMSKASAKAFAELTQKSVGRPMAFRVDGKVLMKPVIREPVLGGAFQISNSSFTVEEVKSLAAQLSSGAAKIQVEIDPQ
ncbi:MAG: SecDF P1 head subdomain-containing protein [Xanthobacteraceae bacterium]